MDSADYLFNLSSISSYRWMTECAGALSDFYYELAPALATLVKIKTEEHTITFQC